MKERPILFSGPMVRAILEGRKTQTRRVMKLPPPEAMTPPEIQVGAFNQTVIDRFGNEGPGPEVFGAWDKFGEWGAACPYGHPGDRLWVRETCAYVGGVGPFSAKEKGLHFSQYDGDSFDVHYAADGEGISWEPARWRPSLHMHRWASRINLEITGVRVERLQEINDDDATAEGCGRNLPRGTFSILWDSLAKPGSSWADNPWVWVIEFRRTT